MIVLYVSVVIIVLIVILGIANPERFAEIAGMLLSMTTDALGWFFLISTFGFLVFSLFLAFSRYGSIRLGADDDRPKYSYGTWFGMLFSAGMGIGLVFWGVAEPMSHYVNPPVGVGETPEAASLAIRFSFFHWGLHAWGIYTVMALAIAYFSFRKGHSGLISNTFRPLLGDRVEGPIGKLIDTLAVIATAFGVATSLGFGTLQINGGLAYMMDLPVTITVQLLIIVVVTILYMASAMTGLDRGIRILSIVNILVASGLLLFVFVFGPTTFILEVFTSSLGGYLQNLIDMSLRLAPFDDPGWIEDWTLFYWAWWIAWAPFVGTFIARVSQGRTIREFVFGVLLMPSLFGFVWFATFGGTALHLEMFQGQEIAAAVAEDVTSALFLTLGQLPLGLIISGLATFLIITFFVTSADSATFVLGMLSSNGSLNPSNGVKLIWGVLQSSIAAVLLIAGGLSGLQTASIVAAAPFVVIMVLMCVSVLRALSEEHRQDASGQKVNRKKALASLTRKALPKKTIS